MFRERNVIILSRLLRASQIQGWCLMKCVLHFIWLVRAALCKHLKKIELNWLRNSGHITVFLNQPPPVALSISAAILQAVSWFSIQRGIVARSQFLSLSLSPLVCLKLAPSFTVVTPAQVYLHKLILFPICCYHSIEIIARLSNSRVMLYEMCFALYLVS